MGTSYLARFPSRKTRVAQMHRTYRTISRQENITYISPPPDGLTPDSLPSPPPPPPPPPLKECTDGRSTLTSLPKFLGWIVYQIFLAMGLRWRARGLTVSRNSLYTMYSILVNNLPESE